MKDLEALCKTVKQMTWNNDHTGAKLAIATHFGLTGFVTIFKAIEELHGVEGCMPSDLGAYRRRKGDELLNAIRQGHGEAVYQRVYDSL